uniref:Uncharacterized protein n=1 Tax=Meloidogyne enterolobii TaxID=390850 RepID=A0A6V7VKS0_MELEN|nr:unnamed protein product [Meloidogyne enterolobii]
MNGIKGDPQFLKIKNAEDAQNRKFQDHTSNIRLTINTDVRNPKKVLRLSSKILI